MDLTVMFRVKPYRKARIAREPSLSDYEPSLLAWVFLTYPLDLFYISCCCEELAAEGKILKCGNRYRAIA